MYSGLLSRFPCFSHFGRSLLLTLSYGVAPVKYCNYIWNHWRLFSNLFNLEVIYLPMVKISQHVTPYDQTSLFSEALPVLFKHSGAIHFTGMRSWNFTEYYMTINLIKKNVRGISVKLMHNNKCAKTISQKYHGQGEWHLRNIMVLSLKKTPKERVSTLFYKLHLFI